MISAKAWAALGASPPRAHEHFHDVVHGDPAGDLILGVIDEDGDLLFFEEEAEELRERGFFVDVEDGADEGAPVGAGVGEVFGVAEPSGIVPRSRARCMTSSPSVLQEAAVAGLELPDSNNHGLRDLYAAKRDIFLKPPRRHRPALHRTSRLVLRPDRHLITRLRHRHRSRRMVSCVRSTWLTPASSASPTIASSAST